jgi:hypothetical protein
MTMKQVILTVWIVTFAMLANIVWLDRDRDPYACYRPDEAGFMIAMVFFLSSFSIFVVGMFNLIN